MLFHTIVALSAPSGHLPLEGKATIREYHPLKKGGEAASIQAFPVWGRGTAPAALGCFRKLPALDDLPALFHPAFPIQPPPLRGTSFHRKEGVSTLAPSLGRGCRAQRGGVGFLFLQRSRLLFAFPTRGRLAIRGKPAVKRPSGIAPFRHPERRETAYVR